MKAFFLIICFAIFTLGCGKFVQSLYISDVENKKYNKKYLKEIEARAASFGTSFKVAVISDSHDYYTDLAKQVKYINKNKNEIAFVIHTGDATNLGLAGEYEMFESFMEDLKVPYLVVIGNHDMLTNGRKIFKQMYSSDLDYSFTFKQTKFILFNNNNWETEGSAPNLNFIEEELQSSTATNNILMMHVQVNDSDRFSNSEISDFESIVSANNVQYLINGHNHNANESIFGGAKRLTVGSPVKGKLLILSISNGGVTHDYVTP